MSTHERMSPKKALALLPRVPQKHSVSCWQIRRAVLPDTTCRVRRCGVPCSKPPHMGVTNGLALLKFLFCLSFCFFPSFFLFIYNSFCIFAVKSGSLKQESIDNNEQETISEAAYGGLAKNQPSAEEKGFVLQLPAPDGKAARPACILPLGLAMGRLVLWQRVQHQPSLAFVLR